MRGRRPVCLSSAPWTRPGRPSGRARSLPAGVIVRLAPRASGRRCVAGAPLEQNDVTPACGSARQHAVGAPVGRATAPAAAEIVHLCRPVHPFSCLHADWSSVLHGRLRRDVGAGRCNVSWRGSTPLTVQHAVISGRPALPAVRRQFPWRGSPADRPAVTCAASARMDRLLLGATTGSGPLADSGRGRRRALPPCRAGRSSHARRPTEDTAQPSRSEPNDPSRH